MRLRASICRHIVFNVHFCMEGVGAPFRVVFNLIDANSVWCNHSNTQPSQVIAPFEISLVPNVAALHGQVPNKLALMEMASFFNMPAAYMSKYVALGFTSVSFMPLSQ